MLLEKTLSSRLQAQTPASFAPRRRQAPNRRASVISPTLAPVAALFLLLLGAMLPTTAAAADIPVARTVDVLVVYTAKVKTSCGGADGVKAKINGYVAEANLAFENSDVQAKLVLVGADEVNYSESNAARNSYSNDLYSLYLGGIRARNSTKTVSGLREEYNADLVVLLREGAGTNESGQKNIAGIAYLLSDDLYSEHSGGETSYVAVVGRDLSPYTFAHEIGHTLGCGHENGNSQGGDTGLFAYSHGYVYTTSQNKSYGTIMSYTGIAKPRFSNPRISTNEDDGSAESVPTGDAASADNARTINETVETVAAYRVSILKVANPVFDISGYPDANNVYWDPVDVRLSTPTPTASIYYTTNGTTPTTASTAYTGAIKISQEGTTTILARAFPATNDYRPSDIVSQTIKIAETSTDMVAVYYSGTLVSSSDNERTYDGPVSLWLRSSKGGVIRYTLDGTAVTETSPVYSDANPVYLSPNASPVTLRARVFREGYRPGEEIVRNYTIDKLDAAAPVLSVNGGTFVNSITLSMQSDTADALFFYSTDGVNYALFPADGITLSENTALSALSRHSDYYDSTVVNAQFTILSTSELLSRHANTAAAGTNHSLFVNANNTLFAGGGNESGQIADDDAVSLQSLTQVMPNVANVAAGNGFSLWTTSDLTLYGTGLNTYGQISGDAEKTTSPARIADNVLLFDGGDGHSLFTTTGNKLYALGHNNHGQLGTGGTQDARAPVLVAENVLLVAAGASHSLFVTCEGFLYGAGHNSFGQLGTGDNSDYTAPVKITEDADVVAVAAGDNHSVFLKSDGTVWAMGYNAYGQLGDGTTQYRYSPVQVAENAVAVAAGTFHTLILKNDGTVWGAGRNDAGQLGNPAVGGQSLSFVQAQLTQNEEAASIAAGGSHSIAGLKTSVSERAFVVFGNNDSGQLGVGDTTKRETPTELAYPPEITSQPLSTTVVEGESATFSVASRSAQNEPLFYQWFHNGEALSEQTRETLTLTNISPADAGLYKVRVTDSGGAVFSDSATLSVTEIMQLTVLPDDTGGGTVTGGGVFIVGTTCLISATPNEGWVFVAWDDGDTSPTRSIVATNEDKTYTAHFERESNAFEVFRETFDKIRGGQLR
jgi:alpha-tubulin suppressor-like RCC1 family protein